MKRNPLCLFAVAALVLAGCNEPETKPTREPTKYTIFVTANAGGEVEVEVDGIATIDSSVEAVENAEIAVTITPDTGYTVKEWSITGGGVPVEVSTGESVLFEMPAGDVDIKVEFADAKYYDKGVVINGITWSTRNVGAPGTFAANSTDAGMFYQWNRKTEWPSTGNITGWDSTPARGDEWTEANDPSPEGWRVPVVEEFLALADAEKVSAQWSGSPAGMTFTDLETGNKMFLPASGFRKNDTGVLGAAGTAGYYWSSRLADTTTAYYTNFDSGNFFYPAYYTGQSYGMSVRPVAADQCLGTHTSISSRRAEIIECLT